MKVDANERICGVRPAELKRLLRNGDRFDTPTAMKHLELEEPEVTSVLTAMQQEGWIQFCGRNEGVDWWQSAQRGRRLVATALLKRISAARGRAILAQLIEEVRAINAETQGSRRVTQIRLFGSLLTGTADNTVGDIDVAVDHRRRNLSDEKCQALEELEKVDAPTSVRASYFDLLGWPETRLMRRVAKVSPYLSIHREHDLTGNLYVEVYTYDLIQERETRPDATPRICEGEQEPEKDPVNETALYFRTPRSWPAATREQRSANSMRSKWHSHGTSG